MSSEQRRVGAHRALREIGCRSAFAVLVVVVLFARAAAQQATEDEIKAAFLFNFVNFVEWPSTSFADASAPFVIGIAGGSHIAAALDRATGGKIVNGRSLVIKRLTRTDAFRGLHVLFISEPDNARLRRILEAVKGQSTLTVEDGERFDAAGGIITLFTEDHRVRFDINLDTAERAQLRISSRLLALARRIRGNRHSERL